MRLSRRSFKIALLLLGALFSSLFTALLITSRGLLHMDYNKPLGFVQAKILFSEQRNVVAAANSTKSPSSTVTDERFYKVILANNTLCDGNVDLLIYIQSHWEHFMKRRILRNTWASKSTFVNVSVRVVFILGKPEKIDDQIKINTEQLIYGDIIETDFTESFQNISLKSKIAMKWIHENCSSSKYVLKTDDDMFVNMFELFEHILPTIDRKKNLIACHVKEKGTSTIIRDKNSKWYIPDNIFPNMTSLPRFCTGYAVVMTTALVHELYKASRRAPIVPVDDVYMFGALTQYVGDIQFINLQDRFTLSQSKGINAYSEGDTKTLIVVAVSGTEAMEELWSYTLLDLSTWAKKLAKIPIKD